MAEETRDTRRDALKKVGKVAAFAIPTMVTFHLTALKVAASDFQSFNSITPGKEAIRTP